MKRPGLSPPPVLWWRYIDERRQFDEHGGPIPIPRIAINLSVWENVEALERFVYQTVHKRFYGRRAEWFEHFEGPYFVMWWVPAGHRPSVEEAVVRLDHLKRNGPSDHAFDWQATTVQLWKTARCAPSESAA